MFYNWWYSEIPNNARSHLLDGFDLRELTAGSSIEWVQNYVNDYTGQKSLCFNSGTSALIAGLVSAGVKSGDVVALSPIGWIATLQAIIAVGAKPLFVDVRSDLPILDTAALVELDFDCVVPTHYNGRLVDLKEFISSRTSPKKPIVVSDACKAFLGHSDDLIPWNYSDVTCFSTGMISQVSTIYGGIACTNSDIIFEKLSLQRNHGCSFEETGPYLEKYNDFSLNLKPSNLHFSLAVSQLEKLNSRRDFLTKLYKSYETRCAEFRKHGLDLVPVNISSGEIPLLIDAICDHRKSLTDYLFSHNIGTQRFHAPLNSSQIDGRIEAYDTGLYPNAHRFSEGAFHFPSGINRIDLDNKYFDHFSNILRDFYGI
jgi:dTDP-4-amino-4,6-dideoxygalactose transaminase